MTPTIVILVDGVEQARAVGFGHALDLAEPILAKAPDGALMEIKSLISGDVLFSIEA